MVDYYGDEFMPGCIMAEENCMAMDSQMMMKGCMEEEDMDMGGMMSDDYDDCFFSN